MLSLPLHTQKKTGSKEEESVRAAFDKFDADGSGNHPAKPQQHSNNNNANLEPRSLMTDHLSSTFHG